MARKFRVQYPGAIYHVMNRGDQREAVFRDGEDRQKLLATLGEVCRKTEWPTVAPPPFLPRRAVCNLENLEGETKPPLGPKDAWWWRWARISAPMRLERLFDCGADNGGASFSL
jgi:hypothetical protein